MCVRAVNACSFVFDSVPKRYKTQEVCGKAVDNYSHALNLFLIDKKTQKICEEAVDDHLSTIQFLPSTTQFLPEAVNNYPSTILFVPECYKTQGKCNKAVNTCFFLFDFVPNQHKTQTMCEETVDDCLAALKFIDQWFFITNKMLEKIQDSILADDDIFFFEEDFSKVIFYANEMGILVVDLDKINLDHDNNPY